MEDFSKELREIFAAAEARIQGLRAAAKPVREPTHGAQSTSIEDPGDQMDYHSKKQLYALQHYKKPRSGLKKSST